MYSKKKFNCIRNFTNKCKKNISIIHIGNIANNAYQNAKMLNKIGYENDVLSYDYYHIMGCPEWDDANFQGEILNPDFPDWSKIDLGGFERPKWFVSGPIRICVKYLMAKKKNNFVKSKIYWRILEWTRSDIAKSYNPNDYTLMHIGGYLRKIKCLFFFFFKALYIIFLLLYKKIKTLLYKGLNKYWRFEGFGRKDVNSINKRKKIFFIKGFINENNEHIKTVDEIEKDFKKLFPDRECVLGKDVLQYIKVAEILRPILLQYDICVMYATNPIFAYLAGVSNYVAYEHGTIRDLPYENSDVGRLMLVSYAMSKTIYVTNVDCYDSAQYIAKSRNTPIVCGLHGIDINRIIQKIDLSKNLNEYDGRFGVPEDIPLFFCPSRHDYDYDKKIYLKGEDKMLRAAASLAKENIDFFIILVEWGKAAKKIKTLIQELKDLDKHILWIKPIQKKELYKVYQSVDAVIDQFYWHSYGAITFEVLASQHSVLISNSANKDYQMKFFGDLLPYFACEDENDILKAMKEVIGKTPKYKSYVKISREWICEHHSNERIVVALLEAFDYCTI